MKIHIDTRTGERIVDTDMNVNDGISANDAEMSTVDSEMNANEDSRGPVRLRRGGARPNLSTRKNIVRPNSDHLPSGMVQSNDRVDDLRNALSRNRNSHPDSDFIIVSETQPTGIVRKIDVELG